MTIPCRSLAVVAEVKRGFHPPPAGSSSVHVAAAARAGVASRHSRGTSMVMTDVFLLPSAIHFYDILFLLGAVRGFLGQELVISPAEGVCAVGQLAGEWLLLPWPCPALAVPSVPLEKASLPWALSQRCCCLCSPVRSWWHFMFLPKLSTIFTVYHQTPVCHPV